MSDKKKQKAQNTTEPAGVDLTSMKPKYNTKSKSSMVNVLAQYGLEEEKPKPKKIKPKQKQKTEKRKVRK